MKQSPNEFKGKAALSLVPGDVRVIAASPLTLQPGSMAYRIVVAVYLEQFVVYNEYFKVEGVVEDLADACAKADSYFENGNYFQPTELAEATHEFAKRVARHADFIKSIYRI